MSYYVTKGSGLGDFSLSNLWNSMSSPAAQAAYAPPPPAPATPATKGEGSWWNSPTTGTVITGVTDVVASIFGKPKQTIINAPAKSSMPGWVMPVALVGGGLLLVTMLRKRSGGSPAK